MLSEGHPGLWVFMAWAEAAGPQATAGEGRPLPFGRTVPKQTLPNQQHVFC